MVRIRIAHSCIAHCIVFSVSLLRPDTGIPKLFGKDYRYVLVCDLNLYDKVIMYKITDQHTYGLPMAEM